MNDSYRKKYTPKYDYDFINKKYLDSCLSPIDKQLSTITNLSSEERIIGKWIDGKNLYERVIETNISLTSDTQYIIPHNIENIDLIFPKLAFIYNYSTGICYPLTMYYYNSHSSTDIMSIKVDRTNITFWMQTGWGTSWYKYVVVNYTKTTDTGGE